MFSIIREDFDGLEKIKLFNIITGEYVSIIPAWGANLNALVLLNNGLLHAIIAGDSCIETLRGSKSNFYRGAKLSPFPNRIANGEYTFRNQLHRLERNDHNLHALHGFLWNLTFRIVHEACTEALAEVELAYDYISNYPGYPFTYSISIVYRLEAAGLSCFTTIHNTGDIILPIGDGWHPYVSMNKKIDALLLKLPACKQIELDGGIPTGRYVPSDVFQREIALKNLILDHSFELAETDGIVETELIDPANGQKIIVQQQSGSKGYNFLQIYTPPDRMSVAIEPMTCAPDAFNNKNGLIELEPDGLIRVCFGIQLKPL